MLVEFKAFKASLEYRDLKAHKEPPVPLESPDLRDQLALKVRKVHKELRGWPVL
jgi:hypothetical protein